MFLDRYCLQAQDGVVIHAATNRITRLPCRAHDLGEEKGVNLSEAFEGRAPEMEVLSDPRPPPSPEFTDGLPVAPDAWHLQTWGLWHSHR